MTSQTRPIELHSSATPNGRKITIMLEELGVPYVIHYLKFSRRDQFRPEFLAISPNNKIPAIIDPEGPGGEPISVFESGAIMKYLATKFGRFYPTDTRKQVNVDEWLFWQMGGFGPFLGQAHHFIHDAPEKIRTPSSATRTRPRASTASSTGALRAGTLWAPTSTPSPTWRSSAGPIATRATRSNLPTIPTSSVGTMR